MALSVRHEANIVDNGGEVAHFKSDGMGGRGGGVEVQNTSCGE